MAKTLQRTPKTPDAEASKLARLLAVGESVKANLYHNLLNKIVSGEALTPGELKTYSTLHKELKASSEADVMAATGSETFPNLAAVRAYLKIRNFKISKSQLYAHGQAGRIRPQKSGAYLKEDVDKYAALYLRRKDGSTAFDDSMEGLGLMEDLARQKLEASLRRELAIAENWEQRNRDVKADFESMLGQKLGERIIRFKSDLRNFAYSHAQTIIELVKDNPNATTDLIPWLLDAFDNILARYAEEGSVDK